MAFQRVPNTAEIAVVYSYDGQTILNTYHAYAAAGYNQAMLDTLAAQIDISPVPSLLADQSSDFAYVRTNVRGLDQENDLTATANASAGNGTVFQFVLPLSMAFAVQKLSGLTGRNARGRVYVAGIPHNYLQSGPSNRNRISTTAAAAYVGHVDGFRATIEAIGPWDAVIVSRYSGGSKRAEGVTFQWIQTASKDNELDNQRRRRPN